MSTQLCKQCRVMLSMHSLCELRRCAREAEWQRAAELERLLEASERRLLETELETP